MAYWGLRKLRHSLHLLTDLTVSLTPGFTITKLSSRVTDFW